MKTDLRIKAKDKIDKLFNRLEEVEREVEKAESEPNSEWKAEIDNLKKSKDKLETLYENISAAGDDTVDQLNKGFNEIADVMEDKLDNIKKSFKLEAK